MRRNTLYSVRKHASCRCESAGCWLTSLCVAVGDGVDPTDRRSAAARKETTQRHSAMRCGSALGAMWHAGAPVLCMEHTDVPRRPPPMPTSPVPPGAARANGGRGDRDSERGEGLRGDCGDASTPVGGDGDGSTVGRCVAPPFQRVKCRARSAATRTTARRTRPSGCCACRQRRGVWGERRANQRKQPRGTRSDHTSTAVAAVTVTHLQQARQGRCDPRHEARQVAQQWLVWRRVRMQCLDATGQEPKLVNRRLARLAVDHSFRHHARTSARTSASACPSSRRTS